MAHDQVLTVSIGGFLSRLDAFTGEEISEPTRTDLFGPTAFVVDPAGNQTARGFATGDVVVFDSSGQPSEFGAMKVDHLVIALAFSPNGRSIAVGTDIAATVFDVATGRRLASLPGFANGVAFTPDGAELIVGDGQRTAHRFLVSDWTPIGASIVYSNNGVTEMRARADRLLVALSSGLRMSEVTSGRSVGKPLKLPPLAWATVSPDGMRVAVSNATQTGIVVWDLNPAHWPAAACLAAGRNLTKAEWVTSFGDEPYRATCEQWPAND
jgi:DNA-binding beta-propeller fold protein YncE